MLTVIFNFERWIESKKIFMLLLLLIVEKVAQGYFRYGYVPYEINLVLEPPPFVVNKYL
jgi:hypothetical protein